MSNILEEILSTKTRRVKSDDDFYKRCFVKLSKSYRKQVKSSLNNFHCWLNIDNETNLENFLIRIKGIEDEIEKEVELDDKEKKELKEYNEHMLKITQECGDIPHFSGNKIICKNCRNYQK